MTSEAKAEAAVAAQPLAEGVEAAFAAAIACHDGHPADQQLQGEQREELAQGGSSQQPAAAGPDVEAAPVRGAEGSNS